MASIAVPEFDSQQGETQMNDRNIYIGYRWMDKQTRVVDAVIPRTAQRPDRHAAIWAKMPDWHSGKNWVKKAREISDKN
jgi:hypothetical protein